MATLREIKKAFFELSSKEQEQIIKDIYGFSKDVKGFMNMRLLGNGEKQFIEQITKACESETPKGSPKMIKVITVNSILSKAKKSKVSKETLCDMEWIAFDGYMTFLNDFGGGPDSYENKVYYHLENYLQLLRELDKLEENIAEVQIYLRKNTNMYYDHIWELFEEMTGENVLLDYDS